MNTEMSPHFRKVVAEINDDISQLALDIERLTATRNTLVLLYGGSSAPNTQEKAEKPKRKYKKRAVTPPATPPPASAPLTEAATTTEDNTRAYPLSEVGIRIGKSLSQPFTTTDLRARLDGDAGRAYTWVAAWKNKGWIETAGFGSYRRAESFGN